MVCSIPESEERGKGDISRRRDLLDSGLHESKGNLIEFQRHRTHTQGSTIQLESVRESPASNVSAHSTRIFLCRPPYNYEDLFLDTSSTAAFMPALVGAVIRSPPPRSPLNLLFDLLYHLCDRSRSSGSLSSSYSSAIELFVPLSTSSGLVFAPVQSWHPALSPRTREGSLDATPRVEQMCNRK